MSKWAAREEAREETGVWIDLMRPLDLISVTWWAGWGRGSGCGCGCCCC